jgi:hypothetical protein
MNTFMTMKSFFSLSIVAIFLLGLNTCEPAIPASVLIRHVTLIDGTGAQPQENMTIFLQKEQIAGIYPNDEVPDLQVEQEIDGQGKYLLPGLIDMHVHINSDYSIISLFAPFGITTVRDVGTLYGTLDQFIPACEAKGLVIPNVYYAGGIIDGNPPSWPSISYVVTDPEQAPPLVDQLANAGVNLLKVYNSLSKGCMAAVADAGKAHNLHVTADIMISKEVNVADALEIGVKGLEHGSGFSQWLYKDWILANNYWDDFFFGLEYIDPWPAYDEATLTTLLESLVAAGMYLTPTFIVENQFRTITDPVYNQDAAKLLSPALKASWAKSQISYRGGSPYFKNYFLLNQHIVSLFQAMKGTVIAGTDTPNPYVVPGDSLHQELELLVQAGLSPMDAIMAATSVPAKILQQDHLIGTIAVGKQADLLLLTKNPLESITNSRAIETVFLKGVGHIPGDMYRQAQHIEQDIPVGPEASTDFIQ